MTKYKLHNVHICFGKQIKEEKKEDRHKLRAGMKMTSHIYMHK